MNDIASTPFHNSHHELPPPDEEQEAVNGGAGMTVRIIFDAEDESIVGERIEDDAWDGAYASRLLRLGVMSTRCERMTLM